VRACSPMWSCTAGPPGRGWIPSRRCHRFTFLIFPHAKKSASLRSATFSGISSCYVQQALWLEGSHRVLSQYQTMLMWHEVGNSSGPSGHHNATSSRRPGGERAYNIPVGQNKTVKDDVQLGVCLVGWESLGWFTTPHPCRVLQAHNL
jgi:hypothetical protein